jgi:antitoxin component YwqK of YwqJK toxin-antitoxin module
MENINKVDKLGRRQGLWIFYYRSIDRIRFKINYKNGLYHGKYFCYKPNGYIGFKSDYFNNQTINYSIMLSENATLNEDEFSHNIF